MYFVCFFLIFYQKEKDTTDYEPSCFFQVDEYGFFIHWKSEPRVRVILQSIFRFFFFLKK